MAQTPSPDLHDDRAGSKPQMRQLRDGTILISFRVILGTSPSPTGLILGCDVDGELSAAIYGTLDDQ